MQKSIVLRTFSLDEGWVLTPERYDPRRLAVTSGELLSTFVTVINEQISKRGTASISDVLVLDTSDAREGVILTRKHPVPVTALKSAKKLVQPGDVIISRLRPYLRQVALVDNALAMSNPEVGLCVSTEFFVLRGQSAASIAFLVPFLLSAHPQELLAASQEGGHHPRFNQISLLRLTVPSAIITSRAALSADVERVVNATREADLRLQGLIAGVDQVVSVE